MATQLAPYWRTRLTLRTARTRSRRSLPSPALDLDAHRPAGVRHVRLGDLDPHALHARIGQALLGDALGQRLLEVPVLGLRQQDDAVHPLAVVEHAAEPVGAAIVFVAHP